MAEARDLKSLQRGFESHLPYHALVQNEPRYDPGLRQTAPWRSAISLLDADAGLLFYRGRSLQDFVDVPDPSWIQLAVGLITGSASSNPKFVAECAEAMIPEAEDQKLASALTSGRALPRLAALLADRQARALEEPPSSQLLGGALGLAILAGEGTAPKNPGSDPAIMLGQALGLRSSLHPHALQLLLICHADLEMNCSTTALRTTFSSGAGSWAAMASACLALHGPLHGGASQAVLQQWQEIGNPEGVPAFLTEVRSRQRRAVGFGHPVLRRTDPRALVLGPLAKSLLANDPLFQVAEEICLQTQNDPFFTERGLFPNVDYWSGLCWRALGLSPSLEPLLFAAARTAGWTAHLMEMTADPDRKLISPQQIYSGSTPE